jgi:hypothetical protein
MLALVVAVAGGVSQSEALQGRQQATTPANKAATQSAAPSAPQKSTKPTSNWRIEEKTNLMDHSKEVSAILESEDKVPLLIGSYRPRLMVRCLQNEIEAAISVGTPIQNEYGEYRRVTVRVKFDEGEPLTQKWIESTSLTALFAPDPILFSEQLSNTKTFLFEFTPFQHETRVVRFQVFGLKDHLPKIQEACGRMILLSNTAEARRKLVAAWEGWFLSGAALKVEGVNADTIRFKYDKIIDAQTANDFIRNNDSYVTPYTEFGISRLRAAGFRSLALAGQGDKVWLLDLESESWIN